MSTSKVGTAEDIDKLKYDLCLVDKSFDKLIVEVTNHETSKFVYFYN